MKYEVPVIHSQDEWVDRGPVCHIEMSGLYPQINGKSLTDIQQQKEMIKSGDQQAHLGDWAKVIGRYQSDYSMEKH